MLSFKFLAELWTEHEEHFVLHHELVYGFLKLCHVGIGCSFVSCISKLSCSFILKASLAVDEGRCMVMPFTFSRFRFHTRKREENAREIPTEMMRSGNCFGKRFADSIHACEMKWVDASSVLHKGVNMQWRIPCVASLIYRSLVDHYKCAWCNEKNKL